MRGIKTTTISILAVGLLAGSEVGVAAQDEEAPSPESSAFRATFGGPEPVEEDEETGRVTVVRIPIDASDPRASGLMTSVIATNRTPDFVGYSKEGVRLDNDGGAWVGAWVWFSVREPDERTKKQKRKGKGRRPVRGVTAYFELTGEGGYDGLSMVGAVGPRAGDPARR